MESKKTASLLGRLAVHFKLISMEQLATVTAAQGRDPSKNLGDIMLEMSLITQPQLDKLVAAQRQVIVKQKAEQAVAQAEGQAQPKQAAAPVEQPTPAPAAKPAPTPVAAVSSAPSPEAPAPVAAPSDASSTESSLRLRLPEPQPADKERLQQILRAAHEAGASDVHLHSGAAEKRRVNGRLVEADGPALAREEVERLVSAALNMEQRSALARYGELDFCYTAEGIGRFRANAYRQQRGFDVVMRAIPAVPPTLEELGLPNALAKYTNFHQGMVLVTGPAGCGKSSTLAALVNLINEEREEHILTIEDPIEYVHSSKRCLVNQRHAGRHTASFARALRGALREDPDVIVVGELRDLETISLAMTAAETGHLVLATLHTKDAIRTVNRMIGAFPSNQQDQVRTMLSESLRAVISQRLVPTADGSARAPALEILVINKAIGNLIRDGKTTQIRSAMQTGRSRGMCLLEQSLNELVSAGTVTREEARRCVDDPKLITD